MITRMKVAFVLRVLRTIGISVCEVAEQAGFDKYEIYEWQDILDEMPIEGITINGMPIYGLTFDADRVNQLLYYLANAYPKEFEICVRLLYPRYPRE